MMKWTVNSKEGVDDPSGVAADWTNVSALSAIRKLESLLNAVRAESWNVGFATKTAFQPFVIKPELWTRWKPLCHKIHTAFVDRTRIISQEDLTTFYDLVVPPNMQLPWIVEWNGTVYSWFRPAANVYEWVTCRPDTKFLLSPEQASSPTTESVVCPFLQAQDFTVYGTNGMLMNAATVYGVDNPRLLPWVDQWITQVLRNNNNNTRVTPYGNSDSL